MGKDEGERRQRLCSELGGAVHEHLTFKVPIWVVTPTRLVYGAGSKEHPKIQRSDEGAGGLEDESLLGFTEVAGHVGSSYDPEILNWPAVPARDKACVAEVLLSTPIKRNRPMIRRKSFLSFN